MDNELDMNEIDLDQSERGEEDDAVSYGDVTVRRSHVSKPPAPPADRTGAQTMVDLQLFTAPLKKWRNTLGTEDVVNISSHLPTVDEYKVQSAYTTGTRKKRPSAIREFLAAYGECVFMTLMFLSILVGSALVGSVIAKNSVGTGTPAPPSPDDVGEGAVDLNGDSGGSLVDSALDMREERFSKLVDFISGEGWTSMYKLADEGSPQMRATAWLADMDDSQLPISNTVALRERYALAVVHFATNGRDWERDLGFLSSADACDWGVDGVQNKEGELVRLGVDCTCRHADEHCESKDPSTVKRLLLPSMNLQGSIPHEIFLLYDLLELDMNSNKIRGEMSQGLLLLRSLRSLALQFNRIEGSVPTWIGDMIELRSINLSSNSLTGKIPEEIARLQNLVMLNLDDNFISGGLMPILECTNLEAIFLGNNQIEGPLLPQYLNKWPVLRVLDLSDNSIGSTLPANLLLHPTLRVVDLHGNGITGSIPDVTDSSKLEFLALHENNLGGNIPSSIGKLSELYHLDLSHNEFTGDIPFSLSSLTKLEYLFLAFNAFTEGRIPHFISTFTKLRDLSLQRTHRTGVVPGVLGKLANLTLLDLGDNALSGQIPGSLGLLSNLHFLVLYRNYFTGAIPTELHQLNKLQKLVVHDNAITERADYMCSPPLPNLKDFIMECDKNAAAATEPSSYPYCPCCKCCMEDDVNCNSLVWYGNLDPAWDTDFVRSHYKFHENDIPYHMDSVRHGH